MKWLIILSVLVSGIAEGAVWKLEVKDLATNKVVVLDTMPFKEFETSLIPGWGCQLSPETTGPLSPIRVLRCYHLETKVVVSTGMGCNRMARSISIGVGSPTHNINLTCSAF